MKLGLSLIKFNANTVHVTLRKRHQRSPGWWGMERIPHLLIKKPGGIFPLRKKLLRKALMKKKM